MPEYSLTVHRGKLALTFKDGGRTRRITTGTADRKRAEQIAREIWTRLHAAKSERVADLWPAYVADRKADGAITDRFPPLWKALAPHFGHRVGSEITREDCRAYYRDRKGLGYSDSTVFTELSFLRACLRFRYGETAPSIWIPPASKPRDVWLTKEQANAIVDAAASPHVKLFIILGLATGARGGAILDLTWDRVDFEHGTVDYMPPGRVRTNKRRTVVPMNKRAREALLEAHRGRLSDHVIEYGGKPVASIKKAIQRLSAKTGIPFSPHTLRHTCAVWMAQDNVPMQLISQYLGHTSLAMTSQVYARYSPTFMRDASAATEF